MRTNGIISTILGVSLEHPRQHVELEPEEVGLTHVAVAAAVADHRVLLAGSNSVAALEVGELVGAEVDAPVHDRPWREGAVVMRSSDCAMVVDERLLLTASIEELAGVHALQASVTMNFGPEQPHAVDRHGGHLLGVLREGQVDVDPRREGSGPAGARLLRRRGHSRGR